MNNNNINDNKKPTNTFNIIAEGDYACFTIPEFRYERVSYEVPTPSALEGMIKAIYWKPAIRYVIDKIVVFNPIVFTSIKKTELKLMPSYAKLKSQANGKDADPRIYASECRTLRNTLALKDVKYGISFHIELTGLRSEEDEAEGVDVLTKHCAILERRLNKGQFFRNPCFGINSFPVKNLEPVKEFDYSEISDIVKTKGDVDIGNMVYRVEFNNGGIPINNDWDKRIFTDDVTTKYYNPHMVCGVIDVHKYLKEDEACC